MCVCGGGGGGLEGYGKQEGKMQEVGSSDPPPFPSPPQYSGEVTCSPLTFYRIASVTKRKECYQT